MASLLKRGIALIVAVAAVGVVGYATLKPVAERQSGPRRDPSAAVPVLDAAARIDDVPVFLDGVGTARARNSVTVRSQVDGRIVEIAFREGQDVRRGDVLARIDPAPYRAQLDQALARRALDEAQLANARRDLERYARLSSNAVAEKTIDTQRALVVQLTAQLRADDAAIASFRTTLDYTIMVSPIDGRTGLRLVDEGNLVRGNDGGSGIVVVNEITPITVLFTLPQQRLPTVVAAMARGPVRVDALDTDGRGVIDTGVVTVVDNQVDPSTGTVKLKAEFPNRDLQLWPGQFVNVRVLVETQARVVVVPTQAVQRGPAGPFVYAVTGDGMAALRPVELGRQGETDTIVARGVAPGDRVITSGFTRLRDGARVAAAERAPEVAAPRPQPAADDARARVRAACADDAARLCAGVERSGIRACLRAKADQVSAACRDAADRAATRQ